jgi:hypothetical protein
MSDSSRVTTWSWAPSASAMRAFDQPRAGNLAWSLATSRYDEAGITAVSGGRQRPWAYLAAAAESLTERVTRNAPTES